MFLNSMLIRKKPVLFLLFFLTFITFISGDVKKLTLFHINDMHGKIDNLGKMKALIDKEKRSGNRVVFLNAGDNFSGNPYVDQAEPKGEPVLQIFNKMGLDAYVIGNHEFDYDQKVLSSFMKRANFPMICANFKVTQNSIPQPEAFVIIEKDGLKIGVIGVIQLEESNGLPSTLPAKVRNIKFTKAHLMINDYKHLKDKCDIVIVLSHLGFDEDKILARKAGWVDIIVGGHSHTKLDAPHMENGVAIVQAGAHGKFLGRVDMKLDNNKFHLESGKLISLKGVKQEDPAIKKLIDKYNNNPVLMEKIAQLPWVLEGKSAIGYMVSDIIRDYFNLDVVFYNSGGIRTKRLGRVVRLKDIYTTHPFGNYVIKLNMSYHELVGLIKDDYLRHEDIDFLLSGMSYRVNTKENGDFHSVDIFDKEGKPLSKDSRKTYSVGLTNYVVTSGKFAHKDPGTSTHEIVAEIVKKGLSKVNGQTLYNGLSRTEKRVLGDSLGSGNALVVSLKGKGSFAGSSTAGNFAADAIRAMSGADIAFYPSRLINSSSFISAGKVVGRHHLKTMFRYCDRNSIVTGVMKGRDIKAFILKRSGFKKRADLQVSGFKYSVTVGANGGVKMVKLSNGKPIEDNLNYKVSFNDYDFDKFYNLGPTISKVNRGKSKVIDILYGYSSRGKFSKKEIGEDRITVK